MKHGLFLPPFDGLADVERMADLAVLAEETGWDGFFVWDHLRYSAPVRDILDPYVCLAVMAARTSRITLGPMITPLIRRRPQVVARQAVTLDRLSHGRIVMGFGIGDDYPGSELACFGELTDARERGRALNEGITVFQGLASGDEVDFTGEFFAAKEVAFHPTPYRPTGIPLWLAGRWPNRAPIRRAAQHEGMMVIQMTEPEQMDELKSQLIAAGADLEHFDIVVWGQRDENMVYRKDERYAEWSEAGVTWFLTGPGPFDLDFDEVRTYVAAGPPQY
ncbi:MAG: LLM class flavin-dependent oxidoreductase [Actinomycetota bacterium]|jgi:alkanesulfonate monooxygenase SsuD/methylene tetrahydromethanopterin reductase-like flavin-dependent oxidoreductase (luciferase family)|nr:LLM class flavin-dependent oxidoreductase [Actinomycetota bacterium]